jgi:glutamate dehydrogenase/leucine dehydrogenase
MIIANKDFTPDFNEKFTISDMITGYGVAQSVIHYYKLWHNNTAPKKSVLIQGWGNVGASAGFFLSKAGFTIKGIMDREGFLVAEHGFTDEDIIKLFVARDGNKIKSEQKKTASNKEVFWKQKADIFLPCAGSRLVSEFNLKQLIENGCELISCGANVPFENPEILYGEVMHDADSKISVIPDFIANCGMARTFAYCMSENTEITSFAIFSDVSNTIMNALKDILQVNNQSILLSETALTIALKKLL